MSLNFASPSQNAPPRCPKENKWGYEDDRAPYKMRRAVLAPLDSGFRQNDVAEDGRVVGGLGWRWVEALASAGIPRSHLFARSRPFRLAKGAERSFQIIHLGTEVPPERIGRVDILRPLFHEFLFGFEDAHPFGDMIGIPTV